MEPATREAILWALIKDGFGLGPAGHTIIVQTAPEVVGVTGNATGAFYSKGLDTQNLEKTTSTEQEASGAPRMFCPPTTYNPAAPGRAAERYFP